eukprot:768289-Pyramimonas_sp.AAC.1
MNRGCRSSARISWICVGRAERVRGGAGGAAREVQRRSKESAQSSETVGSCSCVPLEKIVLNQLVAGRK